MEYIESGMNGFSEEELPRKFNRSVLGFNGGKIYQTGFVLHTMFVDK